MALTEKDLKKLEEKYFLPKKNKIFHFLGGILAAIITVTGISWATVRTIVKDETIEKIESNKKESIKLLDEIKEQKSISDSIFVLNFPVGTIIPSALDKETFYSLYNKDKIIWMLADGDSVSTDSKYYQISKNGRVPDLRGVFLRGKNYDRNDYYKNSEGDLPLLEYQKDSYKKHTHKVLSITGRQTYDGGFEYKSNGYHTDAHSTGTKNLPERDKLTDEGINASDETRPKNITVNYYIKIR